MKLRFAFLCEYARPMATGAPMAVGIFDRMPVQKPDVVGLIPLPVMFLIAAFEAPLGTPPKHVATLKLVDADGGKSYEFETTFEVSPRQVAPGMAGILIVGLSGIAIPSFGAYTWTIQADGLQVGDVVVEIIDAAEMAANAK